MATARDVVTRALRLIGAIAAGEDASAEDATAGLDVLNDMLSGWAIEGVDLVHITRGLSDDLLVHASYLEGIRYNLALRLCEEYGKPVPPFVADRAAKTFAAFQAHTIEFADDLRVDSALQPRHFHSRATGGYDIDEG